MLSTGAPPCRRARGRLRAGARRRESGVLEARAADLSDRVPDPGDVRRYGNVPRARVELHDPRPRRAGVRVRATGRDRRDARAHRADRRHLRQDELVGRRARLRRAGDRRKDTAGKPSSTRGTCSSRRGCDVMALDAKTVAVGTELRRSRSRDHQGDAQGIRPARAIRTRCTSTTSSPRTRLPGVFAHGMLSMGISRVPAPGRGRRRPRAEVPVHASRSSRGRATCVLQGHRDRGSP